MSTPKRLTIANRPNILGTGIDKAAEKRWRAILMRCMFGSALWSFGRQHAELLSLLYEMMQQQGRCFHDDDCITVLEELYSLTVPMYIDIGSNQMLDVLESFQSVDADLIDKPSSPCSDSFEACFRVAEMSEDTRVSTGIGDTCTGFVISPRRDGGYSFMFSDAASGSRGWLAFHWLETCPGGARSPLYSNNRFTTDQEIQEVLSTGSVMEVLDLLAVLEVYVGPISTGSHVLLQLPFADVQSLISQNNAFSLSDLTRQESFRALPVDTQEMLLLAITQTAQNQTVIYVASVTICCATLCIIACCIRGRRLRRSRTSVAVGESGAAPREDVLCSWLQGSPVHDFDNPAFDPSETLWDNRPTTAPSTKYVGQFQNTHNPLFAAHCETLDVPSCVASPLADTATTTRSVKKRSLTSRRDQCTQANFDQFIAVIQSTEGALEAISTEQQNLPATESRLTTAERNEIERARRKLQELQWSIKLARESRRHREADTGRETEKQTLEDAIREVRNVLQHIERSRAKENQQDALSDLLQRARRNLRRVETNRGWTGNDPEDRIRHKHALWLKGLRDRLRKVEPSPSSSSAQHTIET
eukprot:scaffold781_cov394-Prasinococcus_capsulatus_cf.AAC.14